MKRLIALALVACLPAAAWNPFDKSKASFVLSVVVSVAAQAADYGTTKRAIATGNAAEGNALLTTNWHSGGPLCTPRLIGFKVTMAAGTIVEAWKLHRAEKQYETARDQAAQDWADANLPKGTDAAVIDARLAEFRAAWDANSPGRYDLRQRFTVGNWVGGFVTGATAAHNWGLAR